MDCENKKKEIGMHRVQGPLLTFDSPPVMGVISSINVKKIQGSKNSLQGLTTKKKKNVFFLSLSLSSLYFFLTFFLVCVCVLLILHALLLTLTFAKEETQLSHVRPSPDPGDWKQ